MDMIAGFCTESEQDHKDTLDLMDKVIFDFGYMFKYSERPNTQAQRKWKDDDKKWEEYIMKERNKHVKE